MRILVVHQYFLMPGQPGGSRFNEMARLWTEAGHHVSVIAGTVDYASGTKPEHYQNRWIVREHDDRTEVWRCHVSARYGKSYVGRMWAFFGFTLSATTAALMCRRADIVIATSPPLIAAIPGWIAARLRVRRSKLVFEVRDLWPESAVTTGVLKSGSIVTRLLYSLERWACGRADLINVLSPAFAEDIVGRKLAPPERVVFVPNGADLESFSPGPRNNSVRAEMRWEDKLVFLYAGAHGRANALHQLINAAEIVAPWPNIHIALVGDGPERSSLEEAARARHLTNIQFCGPQPKRRMPDFINAADVGVAVLQNNPTFRTVYPNKVFDYMACRRPVLLGIDGVARALVCEEAQAGIYAEPENSIALSTAIRRLAESHEMRTRLGANGRSWVTENASRNALATRYLTHLSQLVGA